MQYSIIPDITYIDSLMQEDRYSNICFEYDDFFAPEVYEDSLQVNTLIEAYKSLKRDRRGDTLHGAFLGLDIAATDPVIQARSKALCIQSLDIASALGVKGVVFHTGLIGELRLDEYVGHWIDEAVDFWSAQCSNYPELYVYMENSFEQSPEVFVRLMERMRNIPNFAICLDYGHAILTKTPIEVWVKTLAPYIRHMHLNDNDLVDDLHMVPGTGKIDFDEWMALMQKYHIDTTVLLELTGLEKIEQAVDYMKGMNPIIH